MRILNVNSTLSLNVGGGTAERTFQMSRYLAMLDTKTTILTLDIELDNSRKNGALPANVVALPCFSRRFYIPLNGFRIIKKLVRNSDVIHLMGHWSVLNAIVYFAARRENVPYVVCPAGALPLFGRSTLIKKIYNFLVGNLLISNAAGWIAVTDAEFSHFKNYGIPSSEITVIPNGVNEDEFSDSKDIEFFEHFGLPKAPYILFMGRLNSIKGPDLLLQAYIKIQSHLSAYHLVFAGPDGGMLNKLIEDVEEAGLSDRVHFIGYIYGEGKTAAYNNAQLLVVPSRQEAMSIVALEAGVCGTPVLLTENCGFDAVKEVDVRMQVTATVDGIASGLLSLLKDESTLKEISPVWNSFVLTRYSWRSVVNDYINLYKNITSKALK